MLDLFVILYSSTYLLHHIDIFFHAYNVHDRRIPVPGIDDYRLQPRKLLYQGTVLLVVDNAVQLHIVCLMDDNPMQEYYLVARHDILHPCEVCYLIKEIQKECDTHVQEDDAEQERHTAIYRKGDDTQD